MVLIRPPDEEKRGINQLSEYEGRRKQSGDMLYLAKMDCYFFLQ